jgi:hypothetical protein
MAEELRSVSWRLAKHDSVRAGAVGSIFTEALDYAQNSRCLRLNSLPRPRPGCRLEKVYSREATATYVNLIRPPFGDGMSVIVKIMYICTPTGAPDCLLSEHEVEVRMLLLLTALMRRGITDAATIPLALGTLTKEELPECGFLVPGHPIFAEPRQKRTGKYAIIFAEAADGCLTDVLWKICSTPQESSDYCTRAALLQVTIALATLHSIFPSFRHNDLHASNVLVQHIDVERVRSSLQSKFAIPEKYPLLVEYEFDGKRWQIDLSRAPIRCLLWDFSFASIEESDGQRAGLDCVTPREHRFGGGGAFSKTIPNQYCDVHKLFDTLRWVLQQGGGAAWDHGLSSKTRAQIDQTSPPDLSFVDKSLSSQVKIERQRRVHSELQLTSPTRMLLIDGLFDDFRVDQLPLEERMRPMYELGSKGETKNPRDVLRWLTHQTPASFTFT